MPLFPMFKEVEGPLLAVKGLAHSSGEVALGLLSDLYAYAGQAGSVAANTVRREDGLHVGPDDFGVIGTGAWATGDHKEKGGKECDSEDG